MGLCAIFKAIFSAESVRIIRLWLPVYIHKNKNNEEVFVRARISSCEIFYLQSTWFNVPKDQKITYSDFDENQLIEGRKYVIFRACILWLPYR